MEEDIWDLLLDGKPIAPLISENVIKVAPYLLNNEYSLQKLQWDQLEYELYNTKIRNTHPIIIVGFISTWPAFKKWESVDYLANIFGPKPILVLEAKDNLHFFKNVLTNHHEIPGDEAINLILNESKSSEKRWYARKSFKNRFLEDVFLPYRLVHKEWNEHEKPSEIKSPFVKKNCTVWVSTKGNITPLHYDLCHGFLCQVSGIKKVTLFHKDDYRLLYPNETTHQNRTASKIDLKAFQAGDEVNFLQGTDTKVI